MHCALDLARHTYKHNKNTGPQSLTTLPAPRMHHVHYTWIYCIHVDSRTASPDVVLTAVLFQVWCLFIAIWCTLFNDFWDRKSERPGPATMSWNNNPLVLKRKPVPMCAELSFPAPLPQSRKIVSHASRRVTACDDV